VSMDKPFRIEVTVDAPRDDVWRALTEVEQIRHWFGWEYDGLRGEIEYIFVEHAELHPPDRIDFGDGTVFELDPVGPDQTVVRAVKPGDASSAEWKDVYGGVEEGWITFLNQLRHRFAHAPWGERRMLVLSGKLPELPSLPGTPWHSSRYQRAADVNGSLVVVGPGPNDETMLLVTAYDIDDATFEQLSREWTSWWEQLIKPS
jgi:hypothetical protein